MLCKIVLKDSFSLRMLITSQLLDQANFLFIKWSKCPKSPAEEVGFIGKKG